MGELRAIQLDDLHVVDGRDIVDRRVVQRDALEHCALELKCITLRCVLTEELLNTLPFLDKSPEHKLSQLFLLDCEIFGQARWANALLSLDCLHNPGEGAGVHKGIATDGNDSVAHGRQRVLALFVNGAVFFGIVLKSVVFDVGSGPLEICIHIELFAPREILCGSCDLYFVVGLDLANAKTALAPG